MQQQIASFLFHLRNCPLPGIGTLKMQHTGAAGDFTSKMIAAPRAAIIFNSGAEDDQGLVAYLSAAQGANRHESKQALDQFCDKLKQQLASGQQVNMPGIGVFYADNNGDIHFTEQALPASYYQPVVAERVIHPNDEHQILVGDKETTNTIMTELLAPKDEARDNWWVWAIVLGLVAISMIILYFNMSNNTASFGNSIKI
jgi:CCDC81-like prokaryotic HU domain 2